jgi:exonuclease SbcC
VERQEEKPIRTRFDAAFASINTQLLEIQTANEARKQQLVNTAKSVAEMHDTDKAIERFLQLQEQWKLIGITRHHEDRKLWQALQDAGKTIFDKRRDAQQQAAAGARQPYCTS